MESSLYVFKTGLMLATLLSAPVLISVLAVGLLVSLVQAAFQLQDQTLPIVAKIVTAVLVLSLTWSWTAGRMIQYADQVFDRIEEISAK